MLGQFAEELSVSTRGRALYEITREVAGHLSFIGMSGSDQRAGCAACGACSVLPTVGG